MLEQRYEPGGELQFEARDDVHDLEKCRELLDADLVAKIWLESC